MLEQASRLAPEETQENRLCRHYWIIEIARGPVSKGTCRLCEEIRAFSNHVEDAPDPDDDLIVRSSEWDL